MITSSWCVLTHFTARPANPSSPKTLRLGLQVGVAPMELLISQPTLGRWEISESETASILAWCYQRLLTQFVCMQFSLMNMPPSSAVSKIC